MPMPGWWRQLNKRFFNPRTLKTDHKWTMLSHVGRSSGTAYSTPIEAIPVPGGFVIYLMYGRNTDWAKNVLASHSGSLEKDGKRYDIQRARIVNYDEIAAELQEPGFKPPKILRVHELVRLDTIPAP